MSIEEYLRLLPAAPPHLRAMLQLAMHTGMRHGEIRQLTWPHIDRKAGMIPLTPEITKNKRPRMIPLTLPVKDILDGLPRYLHGYLVTYGGKPILREKTPDGALKSACKSEGIPYGKKRRTVSCSMTCAGQRKPTW